MSALLGIVVAMLDEAEALGVRKPRPGLQAEIERGRLIYVSGMGAEAAEKAASVLANHDVAALMSFGTVGALAPELIAGDLICPLLVLGQDGLSYPTDPAWRRRLLGGCSPDLHDGALLSVDAPLTGRDDKLAARKRYGAVAVDLESAAIASVARTRGLPFLALRAVVDDAATELPRAVISATNRYGRPKPATLALNLLRAPGTIRTLPPLARAFATATHALRVVAERNPDFAWAVHPGSLSI